MIYDKVKEALFNTKWRSTDVVIVRSCPFPNPEKSAVSELSVQYVPELW